MPLTLLGVVEGLISLLYRTCTEYSDISNYSTSTPETFHSMFYGTLYPVLYPGYTYPTCPSIPAKKRTDFGHYAQGKKDVTTVEHDWPTGFSASLIDRHCRKKE